MRSCCTLILLFLFVKTGIVFGQPTVPPQVHSNWSQDRYKSRFKFNKQKYRERIDFSRIDTNAIYVRQQQHDSSYIFLRFFKDAYFESGAYVTPPTDAEAESLEYGSWRCYTMDKKGLLVLEVPMPFMMTSNWMYFYGVLTEDSITLATYSGVYPLRHSAPGPIGPWIFYRKPVDFKNRSYQWTPVKKI